MGSPTCHRNVTAAETDGYPLHPWCRRLSAGVTGDAMVTQIRVTGDARMSHFCVTGDARVTRIRVAGDALVTRIRVTHDHVDVGAVG